MKRDGDDSSEPTRRVRPGRIRAERGKGRGLLLRKVSARVRHREGRSRSKVRALSRPGYGPGSRQQRSIVRLQYVANKTPGGWRAHGCYLAREGAQREGDKGLGFDAAASAVEIDRWLAGWQQAEDPRMWKMILSPELSSEVCRPLRHSSVLSAMERDLGTWLEWVAIDHHNTDNPHVHVAIRGRDEAGRPLLLDREYVKHGVRLRSCELATQALGYRTEADRVRARERGIEVQRFGELDAVLEQRMGPGRLVSFEDFVPASGRAAQLRLQLIGRLQYLERLGLASRTGAKTWRLALDHRPALREMQILGDVQKSLARGDLGITDPSASREMVRLEPGVQIRGRVAGTAANELGESPFLVLEATDGRVLLVPQTPAIQERRGEGGLRRGHVVTLVEHESVERGRRVRWTEIQEHGRLRDLVRTRELATVLDLEARGRSRSAPRTEPGAPPRGFARAWARAVEGRCERLAEAGLLVRVGPESDQGAGTSWVAVPQAEPQVELQAKQRDRSSLSFAEAETLAGRKIEHANADIRHHDGRLIASVHDEQGRRFLVVDAGWRALAIPSQRRDLQIGSRIVASLARTSSERGRESQMTWQVRDRLEPCYEIEADWADALEAVPPAGKAGAALLRHKILDAMEERLAWFPLTELLLLTGLRWGEGAGLRWPDVSERGRLVHVQRTVARGGRVEPAKTGASWTIPTRGPLADSSAASGRSAASAARRAGCFPTAPADRSTTTTGATAAGSGCWSAPRSAHAKATPRRHCAAATSRVRSSAAATRSSSRRRSGTRRAVWWSATTTRSSTRGPGPRPRSSSGCVRSTAGVPSKTARSWHPMSSLWVPPMAAGKMLRRKVGNTEEFWHAGRDSNPRPPGSKPGALSS